jgi:hypothetical protein
VAGQYSFRVDTGSTAAYTDGSGNVWNTDQAYTAGSWGYTGALWTYSTTNTISGTTNATLYQTMHQESSFDYEFTVPNGTYQVTFKFAELFFTTTGQRVFSVINNTAGTTLISNLDVVAAAGANTAYDQSVTVTVSGGLADFKFVASTDNAIINGISLVSLTGSGTATASPTMTATSTASHTATASSTPSSTATASMTNTAINTSTNTVVNTATITNTSTASITATPTSSSTPTCTATNTSTNTATITNTPTNTATATSTATNTNTSTDTATITNTPTNTATVTSTATNTNSMTATLSFTTTNTNTVVYTASATPSSSPTLTATPPSSGSATYTATPVSCQYAARVDAGSTSAYTDPSGNVWSVDQAYTAGNWGYTGVLWTYSVTSAISGTTTQALYQTMHQESSFDYEFAVPNGTYQVTFKFAELFWKAAGKRVFSVINNTAGTTLISGLDVYAKAGADKAYDQTVTITVGGELADFKFVASTDNAIINAISLVSLTSVCTPGATSNISGNVLGETGNTPGSTPTVAGEKGQNTATSTPSSTPTCTPSVTSTLTASTLLLSTVAGPNVSRNGEPIKFMVNLGASASVQLNLFSLTGEEVFSETLQGNSGMNTILWLLRNKAQMPVASGIYIFTIQANDGYETVKSTGKVLVFH